MKGILPWFVVVWSTVVPSLAITPFGSKSNKEELECGMRSLALEYARTIQPWRDENDPVFQQIHDALQLTTLCGKVAPVSSKSKRQLINSAAVARREEVEALRLACSNRQAHCIYVAANKSSATGGGDGSEDNPIGCLHKALEMSRSARQKETEFNNKPTKIILRAGIHEVHQPLKLSGTLDSNVQFLNYPNEDAWISGGLRLPGNQLRWDRWSQNDNIFVTDLTDVVRDLPIPKVPSLFTSGPDHRRYIRARYPNDDPEIHSENRRSVCIDPSVVLEWHKPQPGPIPTFDLIKVPKDDSPMDGYNLYASGHGGACADVWGPDADSYWCSNYSQGGWAEVDQQCATTGKMQLPMGVTWNRTEGAGQHLSRLTEQEAKDGIVFAWHSQSWAMHMFRITNTGSSSMASDETSESDGIDQFHFEKGGGRQGGRNWCRCDQCTYAGWWCGQHQDPPDKSDDRLISGLWWVENILPELDQPGEFWYNSTDHKLYVYPNATDPTWTNNLHLALVENVMTLRDVSNVEISGIGFRDTAATFMSDWSAPSGGDWSLHRGGTVFLENATDVVIRNNIFRRLDSNAIFLSRRNRNVLIQKNTFEWLAENAIATWGDTNRFDATSGDQPWNTMVFDNVMRELGIYEKQSSPFASNKAALSNIRNNIMFNLPRAGINFNDMIGGGDRVTNNLIFNSCRESGDHGPINSWDRQAYMSKLKDGKTPSFEPLPRLISGNLIFANYGADQGVDNDDGSSWFHVQQNVFYDASGFKMDYGGHDSIFEDNLVLASGRKSCTGFGSFLPGHGDIVRNNRCIVDLETISSVEHAELAGPRDSRGHLRARPHDNVAGLMRCKNSNAMFYNNSYYTLHGNATISCADVGGDEISLEDIQQKYGLEKNSVSAKIPPVDKILEWAKSMLIVHSYEEIVE